MSYFILYLCSIATSVTAFFQVVTGIITAALIISSIIIFAIYADDDLNKAKSSLKSILKWFWIPVVTGFCSTLIPNSTECYAIFGVGATIEYVQSNEELKQIPDNAFKAINYYLESIPKDSIN